MSFSPDEVRALVDLRRVLRAESRTAVLRRLLREGAARYGVDVPAPHHEERHV